MRLHRQHSHAGDLIYAVRQLHKLSGKQCFVPLFDLQSKKVLKIESLVML